MKNWKIKLDSACAAAMALTAVITLCSCKAREAEQHTYEPTTAATIVETAKEVQEPIKKMLPVTEEVEPAETEPEEALPPIALYDVPLSEDLQIHIIETAKVNGIDPAIIFAIAHRESNYKADIIGDNGASVGLMQVQPYWHSERMERLGCSNLLDPFQNVTVAVDYLVELLTRYKTIDKALVAYNKGHYAGTVTEYAVAVLNLAEEVRNTKYLKAGN